MSDQNQNRRRWHSEDLISIRDVIRHELEDRASLKKNGHSWKAWVFKVFTPKELLFAGIAFVALVYTFGGDVRTLTAKFDQAADTAKVAADKADLASNKAEAAAAKAEAAAALNSDLERQIVEVNQKIDDGQKRQAEFRSRTDAKLAQMPTRRELKEAVDLAKGAK